MKKRRILSLIIALLMALSVILPAIGALADDSEAFEFTIIPHAGDGVILSYDETAFSLLVRPMYGVFMVEETRTLTLTARFESGWIFSSEYSSFFSGHSGSVTVTQASDGTVFFAFKAKKGDLITRDELLTVGVYASAAQLPKLEITAATPFAQIGKKEWVDASFKLTLGTKQYESGDYEGTGAVKGRGNTSWGQPKKPYSIKLSSKASLLDIPKTKKYAIIPSYSDPSMLRNYMAYKSSLLLTGIDYVPKCEFVEVYLNGQYNGIYLLVERVDIEKTKINITEASADDITGGYLIEKDIDGKIDFSSDQWFDCPYWANQSHDYFVLKTPEPEDTELLAQMLAYLTDYMQSVHGSIMGTSGEPYEKYVDVDSWIDFIIVQEIAKNIDGNLKTSCYLYKQSGDDKLYLTAPWDFDLAYGNPATTWDNADHTHNDYYDCPDALSPADFMTINSSCPWFDRLYDEHEEFKDALLSRYAEYREEMIPEMYTLMNGAAAYISGAVPRDEQKWGVRFKEGVEQLSGWFEARIDWLDGVWLPEGEQIDLDLALNVEGGTLSFGVSPQYPFRGVIKDGRIAAVSGNVGADSTKSMLTLDCFLEAGQELCFDYKVSSEESYDHFRFKANGSELISVSGETGWVTYTFTAPSEGNYSFIWSFEKDYSYAGGSDCVWIDNVRVIGASAALLGDVDGNGMVESVDALLLLRYSAGIIGQLPRMENADVNGDGAIDSMDALLVLRAALGIV